MSTTSAANTSTAHAAMNVSEQQLRLLSELTQVAYAHAPAFVDAAQSVIAADEATARCRDAASSLSSQLSSLRVAAQQLQESGRAWRAQRALAAAAQGAMARLTELHEAPHTVEQAVRSGLYHEALTAVQHVRALHRRHPESPTLARVVDEVDDTLERLLTTTVLSQLSGPLVPSNALKIVMFLQSLAHQQLQQADGISSSVVASGDGSGNSSNGAGGASSLSVIATDPTALPELFLELRSDYINAAMREAAALSGGSSFSCLQKILAIYKVHVSEAVATFKTCFIDSEQQQQQQQQQSQQLSTDSLDARKDLLCRWATLHANRLVALFESQAASLSSGADIAMLLDPVVQCGAALSRSGLDASVSLEGALLGRAEELFLQCLAQASSSFAAALSAYRWRSVVELHSSSKKAQATHHAGAAADGDNNNSKPATEDDKASAASSNDAAAAAAKQQQDGFVPPMSLLRFPPLAHAMNAFLAGCNEVRKCALHGLRPVCLCAVAELVAGVAAQLAAVRGALLLEGPELESLRVMATAFAQDFVPHVERCTFYVFGTVPAEDKAWQQELSNAVSELQSAVQ